MLKCRLAEISSKMPLSHFSPLALPISHTTPLHWNTLSFEINSDLFAIILQTNPTRLDFIIIMSLFSHST